MPELKLINFKVKESEKHLWQSCAHEEKMSFSKWIRVQCAKRATELRAGNSAEESVVPNDPVAGSTPAQPTTAIDIVARAREALKRGTCENRVPKGTFCKRCSRIHA